MVPCAERLTFSGVVDCVSIVMLDASSATITCTPSQGPAPILLGARVSSPNTTSSTPLHVTPKGEGRWLLGLPKGKLSPSLVFTLSFLAPRYVLASGSWVVPVDETTGPLSLYLASIPPERLFVLGADRLALTIDRLGDLLREGCFGTPPTPFSPLLRPLLAFMPPNGSNWPQIAAALLIAHGSRECISHLTTTSIATKLTATASVFESASGVLNTLHSFVQRYS
jgi:hypothetical protein